jgi:hypothetical protein
MKKVHVSWDLLKPNENEEDTNTQFEEYFKRIMQINKFNNIPKPVFEQWIYPHHHESHTLNNYAWINYENIEFELCAWTFDELSEVYVIEDFRDCIHDYANFNDFDRFCCLHEDLECWKQNGTWRTPPIILDLDSISSKLPSWSDLKRPYQLVEGHSRLGYLHAMKIISKLNKGKLASKHNIYLMKEKSTSA